MRRRVRSVVICLLLVFSLFITIDISLDISMNTRGTILYVNTTGTGGAYTSIQSAINAASDGDTVFVYNGTYFENVVIDKIINLTGEDRDDTIIDGSNSGTVIKVTANRVNITRLTITKSGWIGEDAGLELNNVEDCCILNNNISSNGNNGIRLYFSDYNDIVNNTISMNDLGIIVHSRDNMILGNNISENWYGIRIQVNSGNDVINNTIVNNYNGIHLYDATGNNISNNNVSFNDKYGIYLEESNWTFIDSNTLINNGIVIRGGSLDYWNTHNINISNTVNGKSVYYCKNQEGKTVPIGAGQVILANCTNIRVENQEIKYASQGIQLGFSSNNTITGNNASLNNEWGISLLYSNGNNISENNISMNGNDGLHLSSSDSNNIIDNTILSNSEDGIQITESEHNTVMNNTVAINSYGLRLNFLPLNNRIFYNKILNNTVYQAADSSNNDNQWDNGYPFGGNYWSDYSGVDNFKGPNQDIPGSDGIGDSPYIIDANSQDKYPLMEPFTNRTFDNYTVLKQGWNLISIPLIQEEQEISKVLEMINGSYDAVQWYNITYFYSPWKHFKVGKPFGNDLFYLNESMGFWIHIIQPRDTIFLYNGTQPTTNQSITLHTGWNMVGYPSLSNRTRDDALNNLNYGSDVDAVWTFNAATQTWHEIGLGDYFELGRGYWVHSKVTKVWDVPL